MLVQPISQHVRARPMPTLPVADMVLGQTPETAAAFLPRLFNLCRVAQGIAARAAFGLPLSDGWQDDLRREIVKEHVVKLCLKWPGLLCLPPRALPRDWATDDDALRRALFGEAWPLPQTYSAFCAFLGSDVPIAPVLRAIKMLFPARTGSRSALPLTTSDTIFSEMLQENSVAARHANHPVLRQIETVNGRGPLWNAIAVIYDIAACLDHSALSVTFKHGYAVVPAARGFYAIRAGVTGNRVTSFARLTPTDHLLADGGPLDQSLATLPADRAGALAPLLLSILDPCFPVALEHTGKGVAAHA
ncbi:hydrogenase expression/formation protein HupK [Litoreibacter roseus]|uniref:HupK protein n=1 Tax=Litoreibacter roseus TaxID=2601869 RepID=A0A6N6JD59_9RHOB|nr:hydrogenase expression/formation protein HupK [Litoreibacter roseus]GFE63760.1 HupK protein [Litoreibacter roseus]